MRRFFIEKQKLETNSTVTLTGDELHHMKNVARLEVGERVQILDGHGKIAVGEITELGKKSGSVFIHLVSEISPPQGPLVHLIVSIPQLQRLELVIQKAVELGCHSVTPVVSERSFFHKIDERLLGKAGRWNKIALEACKQSGRPWPMAINNPVKLESVLKKMQGSQGIFLYEGEGQSDIKTALSEIKSTNPKEVFIFVGSEGGFSLQEVTQFQDQGLFPVTMGSIVLRVETACIAVLSVIQYEFDKMR